MPQPTVGGGPRAARGRYAQMRVTQTPKSWWWAAVIGLGLLASGCTFYTSCPSGTQQSGSAGRSGTTGGSPTVTIQDGKVPDGDWVNVTPDLSGIVEQCGPAFYISAVPDGPDVIASISGSVLWATDDAGESWRELGRAEGSAVVTNRANAIVYDPDDSSSFWEAGYLGAGAFHTADGGTSFKQLGDLQHLDAISVDFTNSERRTLLATGHESRNVYKSDDGGDTWVDLGDTIPTESKHCRYPLILDKTTFLLGCGGYYDPGVPTTLRSTDGGESWTQVYDNGGGAEPLYAKDGAIYWPKEFDGGLARSDDQGETWETVMGPKVLLPVKPVELPDGRVASLTDNTVVISDDAGKTWARVTPPMPFTPSGFTYSAHWKAFFIFQARCLETPTPAKGDEIQRFDFDYQKY